MMRIPLNKILRVIIILLVCLINTNISAQYISNADSVQLRKYMDKAFQDSLNFNDRHKYVDSIEQFSRQINHPVGQIHALYAKARILKREERYQEALNVISDALILCTRYDEETRKRDLHIESLSILLKLSLDDMVIQSAPEVLQMGLFSSLDSAIVYNNLGIAYYRTNVQDKALNYLFKSISIYQELNDSSGIASSLNNIGLVLESQGDIEEALSYYERSAAIYHKSGNLINYATLLRNMGSTYLVEGYIQKALDIYKASLLISESIDDLQGIAKAYHNLAIIEQFNENYKKSNVYLNEAINYFNQHGDYLSKAKSLYTKAQNYIHTERYVKAESTLKEALGITSQYSSYSLCAVIYHELSKLYELQNDYKKAFTSHSIYSSYKDSLQEQTNNRELEKLKLEFNVKQIRDNYEKELDQAKRLSQMELDHQKRIRNLFIYGFIVTFLLLIWGLRSLFIIRKRNVKLMKFNRLLQAARAKNQALLNETLAIFNNTMFGMILVNREGAILRVNKIFCDLTGYTQNEIIGKHVDEFHLDQEYKIELQNNRDKAFKEGRMFRFQSEFLTKNKEVLHCDIYGRPLDFDNPNEILWIANDLSKEKEIESQLNIFKRFIESSSQGLAMATLDLEVVYLNPYLKNMLGIEGVHNRNVMSNYPEKEMEFLQNTIIPQVLETGSWVGELKQINKKGEQVDTLENFFLIKSHKNEALYLAVIISDITYIKQTEQALKESNEAKSQMLSIIGHDLRGPVGNLYAFLDFMISDYHKMDKDKIKKNLVVLRSSTTNTLNLLENLLFWARSEKGEMIYHPGKLQLSELIDGVVDLFNSDAEKRGISIQTEYEKDLWFTADDNMLRTILRNLIANALKFTVKGYVKVEAETINDSVRFCVSDTGVGIKKEVVEVLFDKETIYSNKGLNNEHGTGLGLNLCSRFVEFHGGEIWVESEPEKGSKFFFTIPLK